MLKFLHNHFWPQKCIVRKCVMKLIKIKACLQNSYLELTTKICKSDVCYSEITAQAKCKLRMLKVKKKKKCYLHRIRDISYNPTKF